VAYGVNHTEDILGVEWFKGVFLAHCGEERPRLIILDGHHSHETIGIIDAARKENILLLCPTSSHHAFTKKCFCLSFYNYHWWHALADSIDTSYYCV
jgi:hypothetical protein